MELRIDRGCGRLWKVRWMKRIMGKFFCIGSLQQFKVELSECDALCCGFCFGFLSTMFFSFRNSQVVVVFWFFKRKL